MLTLPNQWSALHSGDFALLDLARTVAVLPLGATEQHGPHLPMGVDTRLVQAMVEGALDRKSTRLNSSHIPLSRMPSSA